MKRSRALRALIVFGAIVTGIVIAWMTLPGRVIDPRILDYVQAFDDPGTRSIIVIAAFDAGSFAVIDSCTHQWNAGGELTLVFRSKWFRSRDGRTIRIGAFRVPYPSAGAVPASLTVRGGTETVRHPINPMPANFTTLVPAIDSPAG
jgi:hypothetical protein